MRLNEEEISPGPPRSRSRGVGRVDEEAATGTRDLAERTSMEDSEVERAHGSNTGDQGHGGLLSGRV